VKPVCDADLVIPAGDRVTLITVEAQTSVPNGSGGQTKPNWVAKCTAWVKMEAGGGSEKFRQQALASENSYKFSGLWNDLSSVLSTDRISLDGVYYNIRSIENKLQRNVTAIIKAESGVSQ
jgi:SPP1 family predicted phage head-tail adaptor